MSLEERARQRRMRMAVHRAVSFEDAERRNLSYRPSVTPEERLEAYMAIRRDVDEDYSDFNLPRSTMSCARPEARLFAIRSSI